jgi:hypothetical protein
VRRWLGYWYWAYLEEVHAALGEAGGVARQQQGGPDGEVLIPVGQGGDSGPGVLVGGAQHAVVWVLV